jgi:hypothetical protein
MLGKIIGLVLGAVFVGALAGTAITTIRAVNTSSWGGPAAALWAVMGLVVIAGFVILILKEAGVEF